jgi:hypothetical protein
MARAQQACVLSTAARAAQAQAGASELREQLGELEAAASAAADEAVRLGLGRPKTNYS